MRKQLETQATVEHDPIWTRQLAAELKQQGVPIQGLLAKAGIQARVLNTERARIRFAKSAAFFEAASEATNDPLLGFRFGQTRDTEDAGILGYVGLSSATLGDAAKNMCRYRKVANEAVELQLRDFDATGRMRWWFQIPATAPIRQFREFSATNYVRSMRQCSGRNLRPKSLCFMHPRNSNIAEFERFFGCPVTFGESKNQLVWKLEDLKTPLLTANNRLLSVLRGYCEDTLSRRKETPPTLIEQVERQIADRLAKGEAKLETVASELGLSSRTLSRRLSAMETSFNTILDELRKALATRYLKESGLNVTEISYLLGYTEVSTFAHAFKRWTGTTPGAFRAAHEPPVKG